MEVAVGDVNIKIIVSDAFAYSKSKKIESKFFIGYKYGKKIRQLFIRALHMSGYANTFKEAKYMNFINKSEELLKKDKAIWNEVSNIMEAKVDSQPMYDEKYLRAIVNFCNSDMNADFCDKKSQLAWTYRNLEQQ